MSMYHIPECSCTATPSHSELQPHHRLGVRRGRYEVRELAEGGEFFDILGEHEAGCRPIDALKWMVTLVDAVAHCHAHGAVHGQLLPENVLLRNGLLQVTRRPHKFPCPLHTVPWGTGHLPSTPIVS